MCKNKKSCQLKLAMHGIIHSIDMIMDDKLVCIPNDDNKNYPFCRTNSLVKRLDIGSLNQPKKDVKKVSKLTKKRTCSSPP